LSTKKNEISEPWSAPSNFIVFEVPVRRAPAGIGAAVIPSCSPSAHARHNPHADAGGRVSFDALGRRPLRLERP
jgi:hypothetical protein